MPPSATASSPAIASSSTGSRAEPVLYVLYGTETGNAKGVASDASARAERAGIAARVLGLEQLSAQELVKVHHAILVVSTTGEGDMPYNAEQFWDELSADGFPHLEELAYGVLALGDSVYEEFCSAGIAFDERLAQLGATRLVDRVDCDFDYETPAAAWLDDAIGSFADSMIAEEPAASHAVVVSSEGGAERPRHPARIVAKRVLTQGDTEREVVHYTIGIGSGTDGPDRVPFDWKPGDSLNIFYGNDPALVGGILDHLGLRGDDIPPGADVSLRELLTDHLELRTLSRELVQEAAAQDSSDELQHMLGQSASGVFEAWRESHDLLQLLIEHPTVTFDAERLVSLLRQLQPRAYSIASSPLLDHMSIDLSVRTVRYLHDGRIHHGVVSGGLSQRSAAGDPIVVQHLPNTSFRLPDDPAAAVIMVGAGVGVAPFRGFLQHRIARGDSGRNWLFHGIRNTAEDELYADEFAMWQEHGLLSIYDVCASRIPQGRQYVQHRISDRGRELFEWLDAGAVFYVCGDARHMAKDVRSAVRAIAADVLGSATAGEAFVDTLHAEHRYLQDVY